MKRDGGGFRAEGPAFVRGRKMWTYLLLMRPTAETGNIVFYVELEPTCWAASGCS